MAEKENNAQSYIHYNTMVNQTSVALNSLEEICTSLKMENYAGELHDLKDRIKNREFTVGILGEFKRGKSTVINALLGKEIVPADVLPATATLNRIRWDSEPHACINFKNGSSRQAEIGELANYITKITAESEATAESVEDAEVYYPCSFCKNGVQIIDTPGLNDDERMDKISEEVIPELDAVIFVLAADSPLSISESDFIRNKIMLSDLGRVMFVVNKIDLIQDDEDRNRILDEIKRRIKKSVLDKIKDIFGDDSEEYNEAKLKMADVNVFGISASNALKGKVQNDRERVDKSGITEFEKALFQLLTEGRGMLELAAPVNTLCKIAREADKVINMRRDAIAMDREKLEKTCREGIDAVNRSRAEKMEQTQCLRAKAKGSYQELLPDVLAAYDQIQRNLLAYVDGLVLDPKDFENKSKQQGIIEKISKDIGSQVENELSTSAQSIIAKLEVKAGKDVSDIQKYVKNSLENVYKIQDQLTISDSDKKLHALDIGLAILDGPVLPLFGVGGLVNGWRENGWKGALVGGGVGLATGFGAYMASALALAALGVAAVPLLPCMMIGGLVSTFAGKKAVRAIFKKDDNAQKSDQIRKGLREHVEKVMAQLKGENVLESWLRDTTDNLYNKIASDLENEWENSLSSFENAIAQLKIDRQKGESEIKFILSEMGKLQKKLYEAMETINPVKEKIKNYLTGKSTEAEPEYLSTTV